MGGSLGWQAKRGEEDVVLEVNVYENIVSQCPETFEEGPPRAAGLRGGLESVGQALDMAQYGARFFMFMAHTGNGAGEQWTMSAQDGGKENLLFFGHVVAQLQGQALDCGFQRF